VRITQRERYLKRVQSNVVVRYFFHGCVRCKDDVKGEYMHRFRESDKDGSWWVYLCCKCAPDRPDALNYWQKEEKQS
jgi:hypothetical protein